MSNPYPDYKRNTITVPATVESVSKMQAEINRLVSFNQQLMDEVARLNKAVDVEREKRDEAVELLRTIHMGNESARSQDIIRGAIHVLQRNAPEELAAIIRARRNT